MNSVGPRETLRTWGEQTQWRNTAFPRPRDNRSHAASEGRGRGSDLAVTAGELNAEGDFTEGSINAQVVARLAEIAERDREEEEEGEQADTEGK